MFCLFGTNQSHAFCTPSSGIQQTVGRHEIACFVYDLGLSVNLRAAGLYDTVVTSAPSQRTTAEPQKENEMEWEEALLAAWSGEIPPHSAAYYRRRAARSRRVAEGVTTQAVKSRLLDNARHYDGLAATADRAGAEAEEP